MTENKIKTKILKSTSVDPWYNLALEEYLLKHVARNQVILYLWQNDNTVVIGRNQNAWKECRFKKLENEGGKLARRLSGGGAVYHDLGNLNFTFVADKKLYDEKKQTQVIIDAVAKADIEAEFSGRNDIVVNGKKISGNASYTKRNSALHHGTLLVDTDFEKLVTYLQVSKEKIISKGIESVRSRVVNLASINPDLTINKMVEYFKESFVEHYGGSMESMEVSPEKFEIDQLYERYSSWDWRFGHTPNFDITFDNRFSWGEIEVGFNLKNGKILSATIYSDAMNYDVIDKLADQLKNCPFQLKYILEQIDEIKAEGIEANMIQDIRDWIATKEI